MTTNIERATCVRYATRHVTWYLSTAIAIAPLICATRCTTSVPAHGDSQGAANMDLVPTDESPTPDSTDDASSDGIASALVTFGFEVTVTYSRSDEIPVGQRGTGRIKYDTSNATQVGRFEAPPAKFELELGSVQLVAGSTVGEVGPDVLVDVRNDRIVIVGGEELDALLFWGFNIAREIDGLKVDMALVLHDTTRTVLSDDSIPTRVPILSDYDLSHFQIRFEGESGALYSLVAMSVDSIAEITNGTSEDTDSDDDTGNEVSDVADTIYVDDDAPVGGNGISWATAFTYLQDALAGAGGGNEIRVAGGSYKPDQDEAGNITSGDRFATFQLINGVAIFGGYAGLGAPNSDLRDPILHQSVLSGELAGDDTLVACVQDTDCVGLGGPCVNGYCSPERDPANNSYHVVTGSGTVRTAVLDGFTITGGNANGDVSYGSGGGMYNFGGSPTVANCAFEGNTGAFGGGMSNENGSNPTVTDCRFIGNTARSFRSGGGGMNNDASSPRVVNCTFSANSAATGGGMYNNYDSNPAVTNCMFGGNSAGESGGGMYNIVGSDATVTNCTFSGNSAGDGGGMYNHIASNAVVTNCTFSRNAVAFFAGGIVNRDSNTTVTNCIFWGNGGSSIYNIGRTGTAEVNYSIVQGGWSGAGGVGNVDADPLFVDADGPDDTLGTSDDDISLLPGSAAIDAGTNVEVPPGVITDFDGNPRFVDDPNTPDCREPNADCGTPPIVDMGAFESGASVP